MKKLITAVVLVTLLAGVALAQNYKSRQPRPEEREKVAGVDWYLKDGPRHQILYRDMAEGENYTIQATNSVIVLRGTGNITNCVLVFPNPTNNFTRIYDVYNVGNLTCVLTTAVVGSFSTMTNVVATTFTTPTNSSYRVISSGTNHLIVPGTK